MADTTQPTLTNEQNERILIDRWQEMLAELTPERRESAEASIRENLEGIDDLSPINQCRYRCSIYASHLDYWQTVLDHYSL